MQKLHKSGLLPLICITLAAMATSCVPVSRLKYFNDINELTEPASNPRELKVINPFDKIYVKIFSIDDNTNQLFNSNIASAQAASEFLVDEKGFIDYPLTGKINVSRLTPDQAGVKIGKELSDYVSVASVIVQFVENNITVMGEVQSQGVFSYTQDKLTIYEALALGGGISQFGDRKNVILIRQEEDKVMYHKLDLSNSRITGKEFYYVKANDIIIVEPMRASSWFRYNNNNFMTIISSVSSFLAIYTILTR